MNRLPASGLQIVIVAAGASRRLGSPKALARIHGETLLRRTTRLLAPLSGRALIVVIPPRSRRIAEELRGTRARLLVNPQRHRGLSASLRLGVRAARWSAAVLLIPVDLAELSARDLWRLVARWRGAPRRIAARRAGNRGVTPLILPRRFYPLVDHLDADTGLRDLVAGLAPPSRVLVEMPSAAADIDTPAELRAARRKVPARRGQLTQRG